MWNSAQQAYLENRVLSAAPVELVRLLYQGALTAIADARQFLADGKIMERSPAITKASAIVIELAAALDHQRGGAISQRLAALYQYMLDRLLEANFHQSDAALAEVLALLSTLSEAWNEAEAETGLIPSPENPWLFPQDGAPALASQCWSL
jgi:flagellar protein FliS